MSFPYPSQIIPNNIISIYTIYGIKNCEYCYKIKEFFENKFKKTKKIIVKYYDIDDLIKNNIIKNYQEFQEKMEPFIHNYKTFPIIFFNGEFIGGYDDFMSFLNNSKKTKNIEQLKINSNKEIDKIIKRILKKLT